MAMPLIFLSVKLLKGSLYIEMEPRLEFCIVLVSVTNGTLQSLVNVVSLLGSRSAARNSVGALYFSLLQL